MNHKKSGRRLSRNSSHRKAMFKNMSSSLIEHETIKTTLIKAKELRRVIEPLITLSKVDSVANRRLAFARLRNKAAVGKLFTDLGKRFSKRPGGYLRILKCGLRAGDKATMALVQLVEQGSKEELEQMPEAKKSKPATDTKTAATKTAKPVSDAKATPDQTA